MKTAKILKTDLMLYLHWRLHHKYVVTECVNYSDVFSINANGYTCEYEIKTSKSDFDSELKHILFNPPEPFDWRRADNKVQKHHYYRFGVPVVEEKKPDWFGGFLSYSYSVPNKFFFVVPECFANHAALSLQSTKYGVLSFKEDGNYWSMETKKKADFLHKEKVDQSIKDTIMHRLMNEVLTLRGRFRDQI